MVGRYPFVDVLIAYSVAIVISGVPSTGYAWLTGGDIMEATWAAGEMLLPADASRSMLLIAATVAHLSISAFWIVVLAYTLPHKRTILWSLVAGFLIALLDLKLIGPFFPSIVALDFWPQVADHLMFTGTIGMVFVWRARKREVINQ